MANQIMRSADFIQTIGVCAHIDDTSSSYGAGKAVDQMAYLGLSNMRVEAPSKNLSAYIALGERGVKFDVISSAVTSLSTQIGYIDSIAPYVSFVEGPNEVNAIPISYRGLYGAPAAIAYQQDLYATVHSDPLLKNAAVLPFSLSVGANVSGFGNVAAYADYGNVHAYASSGVPPYYMLNGTIASITTTPGDQPLMTETGYYTLRDGNSGVTEDVQAKWLMDTLLQNSVSGVLKTYIYQLEDGYTNPPSDPENHYGLFTADGTAKQAATSIHNLTSILADTGPNAATFTPGTLDATITGMSPDYGFKTIYAKSNGSFDIALWSEPQFFSSATGAAAAVAPSAVTIALGGSYNISVYDPMAGSAPIASYTSVSSAQVSLGTAPLIVEVSPVASLPAAPAPSAPAAPPMAIPGSIAEVMVGSGSDSIVLGLSEDAWRGDAQFTVRVDGRQIGGTQTATALHSLGQSQVFNVKGDFGAGTHSVAVTFLNDAWGGTSGTDRNLYVDSVAAGGTSTAVGAGLMSTGSTQSLAATLPATTTPPASSTPPLAAVTVGAGSDSIVLGLSEDAWQGDAQFTIRVDGQQIGGTQTATALHSLGQSQAFVVQGDFGAGTHRVSVSFLNDAWGGTSGTDRNLYLDSVAGGGATNAVRASLMSAGTTSSLVSLSSAVVNSTTLGSQDSPTLAFISAVGAAVTDAGSAAAQVLTGSAGRDAFVLHAGTANGATITGFDTGASSGDFLELAGYGTGANLAQVDATTWKASSASGGVQDLIHFGNAPQLTSANYLFT